MNDSLGLTMEDKLSQGEQRFITLDINAFGSLMVVVWAARNEDVRIIPVRRAEPKEGRIYEKGI